MVKNELKEGLVALERAIESGDPMGIRRCMVFLDEVVREHSHELGSQLAHYLRNRSYAKALAHLGGEADIPKGHCGGRTDFS